MSKHKWIYFDHSPICDQKMEKA